MHEVIVEICHTTTPGHQPLRISSMHTTWEEADQVFEHFHSLYNLGNNCVAYVELIDHDIKPIKKKSGPRITKQIEADPPTSDVPAEHEEQSQSQIVLAATLPREFETG